LRWQSTDPLAPNRAFLVEIDTTKRFDSPWKQQKTVSANVLAQASFFLLPTDSTVYWWRTRLAQPTAVESAEWFVTSFAYIKNSGEGWGQLAFDQFADNNTTGLVLLAEGKSFAFQQNSASVFIRTFGSAFAAPSTDVSFKVNNTEYNLATQGQPCRNNTINLVAFQKTSLIPYAPLPLNFQDPRTCGREPQVINSFTLGELEQAGGSDLIEAISRTALSDSVVIFSIGNAAFDGWSTSVRAKLQEVGIGASELLVLQAGEPVVIFGRKGAPPGSARIFRATGGNPPTEELLVARTLTGRLTSGKMVSERIGPARAWQRFEVGTLASGSDDVSYTIYGVRSDGTELKVAEAITTNQELTFLDAALFPYLRVEYAVRDEVDLSPAPLQRWVVLYESVAEGILLFRGNSGTVDIPEGKPWTTPRYAFVNISAKDFTDSLTVAASLVTTASAKADVKYFNIKPPKAGDSTSFFASFDTRAKAGANDLLIRVTAPAGKEVYTDNNAVDLLSYLQVVRDNTAPLLDVTFDGRYLENNDFVSASPRIVMVLKDDNPFIFKTDTVGITLAMKSPCGSASCPFVPVYFSRDDIKWSEASATADFRVVFNPTLAAGTYTFRVEATDASGNLSGSIPYEVNFRVAEGGGVEILAPFPNPTEGNINFSFVVKDASPPVAVLLQVYAYGGKLIRSFGTPDFGQLRTGRNQLQWQANDSQGIPLREGLYLYRLQVVTNQGTTQRVGKFTVAR
jgi:hypothetical protein